MLVKLPSRKKPEASRPAAYFTEEDNKTHMKE